MLRGVLFSNKQPHYYDWHNKPSYSSRIHIIFNATEAVMHQNEATQTNKNTHQIQTQSKKWPSSQCLAILLGLTFLFTTCNSHSTLSCDNHTHKQNIKIIHLAANLKLMQNHSGGGSTVIGIVSIVPLQR